jgi:hypothetical protein
LPIIVVSFRKFRGKKPAARRPVNAYNGMRVQRSPEMILTHPPSWPDLFQPFTSFVIEEASKTWMPAAQARSRASSGALCAGMTESFDRDVFLPDAARRRPKGLVMAGLVPAIHVFAQPKRKTWMNRASAPLL